MLGWEPVAGQLGALGGWGLVKSLCSRAGIFSVDTTVGPVGKGDDG